MRRTRRLVAATAAVVLMAAGMAALSVGPASGTASSGQSVAVVAAGHLPDRLQVDTRGAIDVVTLQVTIDPGGTSGWHSHGGPVVVTVVSGTATLYEASGKGCVREDVPAGGAFWEKRGAPPHVLVNQGTEPTVVVATFFLSGGAAPVIDASRPAACDGIG